MSDVRKEYEGIGVVKPELGEEGLAQLQAQFSEAVTRHHGRILEASSLGKRKLSIRIGKYTEGTYLQWRLELPAAEVENLKRSVALIEPILRLMVTRHRQGASSPRPALIGGRSSASEESVVPPEEER